MSQRNFDLRAEMGSSCFGWKRAAVDFLADQAVGMGFYTTAVDPRAKAVVDEFNESVNLDGLLMQATREIVAFGNSF